MYIYILHIIIFIIVYSLIVFCDYLSINNTAFDLIYFILINNYLISLLNTYINFILLLLLLFTYVLII